MPQSAADLCFVHIGKCGGETVWRALPTASHVARSFETIRRAHVGPPDYRRGGTYLFVVRNPIDRALSAFNWRRKLVVETGAQQDRFPGEYEVLLRYPTLDALARMLPESADARADYRRIHHLREGISHYLQGVEVLRAEQVFGVLCQETLDMDMTRVLGVTDAPRHHVHRTMTMPDALELSPRARENLATYLADDYAALNALHHLVPFSATQYEMLMRGRPLRHANDGRS